MLNPVQANYHQGVNWAEEEYDEKAKQPRHHGARVTRSSFDSAVKHRPSDEEMGFGSDRVLHRLYSAPHHDDGHRGRRLEWQNLSAKEKAEVLRLPLTDWMNSSVKNHFVAAMGELVGTTMFLFFAFAGTEVANIRADTGDQTTTGGATGFNVAVLLYVSLSFGFSLMVNVWVFFRISGGLFNPAVTFGMVLVRAISVVRAVCLFFAQMCGSLLASVMVRYLFPETFNVRTTLGGGATIVQGVFIEAILTAELVFTIFMLAKEKHRATFIAPVGIGLALFIAELVGVQFTGGSLNPARSFGPCVITATFDSEHWIYCKSHKSSHGMAIWDQANDAELQGLALLLALSLPWCFIDSSKLWNTRYNDPFPLLNSCGAISNPYRWRIPAPMAIQATTRPRIPRRGRKFCARPGAPPCPTRPWSRKSDSPSFGTCCHPPILAKPSRHGEVSLRGIFAAALQAGALIRLNAR